MSVVVCSLTVLRQSRFCTVSIILSDTKFTWFMTRFGAPKTEYGRRFSALFRCVTRDAKSKTNYRRLVCFNLFPSYEYIFRLDYELLVLCHILYNRSPILINVVVVLLVVCNLKTDSNSLGTDRSMLRYLFFPGTSDCNPFRLPGLKCQWPTLVEKAVGSRDDLSNGIEKKLLCWVIYNYFCL